MDVTSYLLGKKSGGDISEYFETTLRVSTSSGNPLSRRINKKYPPITLEPSVTALTYAFENCYALLETPILYNTSNITNTNSTFRNCNKITTFNIFDMSSVTDAGYMFYNCEMLQDIQSLNTSNLNNVAYMFYNCKKFTTGPIFDLSKATNVSYMFYNCSNITTLPLYDFSSAINVTSVVSGCALLTNVGGFKDLGKAYLTTQSAHYSRYTLQLSGNSNLTEQSLINILNNLYDIASLDVQQQDCQLGSTNLAKLTSPEGQQALANAQAKGWLVS